MAAPQHAPFASRARIACGLALFFGGCRPAADQPDTGCGGVVDPLEAITVADAHLEHVSLWQVGFGVGHTQGDATLVIHDTSGTETSFDARIDGTHAGIAIDASADAAGDAQFPLPLPAGAVLSARDLLGNYSGLQIGGDLGVGGHYRKLFNDQSVALEMTTLSFGIGVDPATWEWLDLELWNDPLEDADPDAPPACTGFFCGDGDGDDDGDDFGEGEGEGGFECSDAGESCRSDGDCCDSADVCARTDASAQSGRCRERCGFLDNGAWTK
ncbi:MAG TPA: hypothetical protein VGO62_14020, partial [Myxococcota bacterium]